MSNRYLTWTLLLAACGLQAYLVVSGSSYFADLETVIFPQWLYTSSKYLFEHYIHPPFFIITVVLTVVLPVLLTILSWVLLGLKRKYGWNLALAVDLYLALPSLALVSMNVLQNLKYHHLEMQNNPEVLLLVLSALHILILFSPPIRSLIFPHSELQDSNGDLPHPIVSAR